MHKHIVRSLVLIIAIVMTMIPPVAAQTISPIPADVATGLSDTSSSESKIVLDVYGDKSLILLLPSRDLAIETDSSTSPLGVSAIVSAKFLPSGDILFIDDMLALNKIGPDGISNILPSNSANGPLFVSADGLHVAYLKPKDFMGGPIPYTNGVAVLDLGSLEEQVLFEVPNVTIHLYGWQEDALIVEIPYWSPSTFKPSDYITLGLLPTARKSATIQAFASLPQLLPDSTYPKTSFDQRYIAYESAEGVIVASLEEPTYAVLSSWKNPSWTKNGLTSESSGIRSDVSILTVTWKQSQAAGNLSIPQTESNASEFRPLVTNPDAPHQTNSILMYRPTSSSTPVSAYYDLDSRTGWYQNYKGCSGNKPNGDYGCSYDKHEGTDYDGASEDPVYASQVGVVANVVIDCANTWGTTTKSYGTNLRINHGTLSDGNTYATGYAHLKCDSVVVGGGTIITLLPSKIAEMGNTGYSSGSHTHLNVRKTAALTLIDPYQAGIISDSPPTSSPPTPPAQPTFSSLLATTPTGIRLYWSTSPNPDSFRIQNLTNGQTYLSIAGADRSYYVQDLQCNKDYQFELRAVKSNTESTRATKTARTQPCPGPAAKITNVQFTPQSLRSGEQIKVSITVQNIGSTVMHTQGPNPNFVYQEGQSAQSLGYGDQAGMFRVAVGCSGATACNDYPYRWGLGSDLNPGESRTVVGYIKLNTVRTIPYYAGLVEEQRKWHQQAQSSTDIVVNPAVASCPDAYEPNENWNGSHKVDVGAITQAYICDTNDKDWFYVAVPTSGRLMVDVWNIPAGRDYDVTLYHGATGDLGGSYWGGNHSERYEFAVEGGQEYDAKVYSFSGYDKSSAYSIRFQFTPAQATVDQPSSQLTQTITANQASGRLLNNDPRVDAAKLNPTSVKYVGYMWPQSADTTESFGRSIGVYVYYEGITPAPGQGAGISCAVHRGKVTGWGGAWSEITDTPMIYRGDSDNFDRYSVGITPPAGLYEYTVYCDIGGQRIWSENPGNVTTVATGDNHTCVIDNGSAKCWGRNNRGQLGDGTTITRTTPIQVNGLTNGITAIASGAEHTCALTSSGGVKCWGSNSDGQLGDGTTSDRLTPTDVTGLTSGVVAIAAGRAHTCALTSSGGVKCWGNNSWGQLGDSTYSPRTTPADVTGLTSGVTGIATKDIHTCAVTAGGGVKCWGYKFYGQLGDGTSVWDGNSPIGKSTPVDVIGLGTTATKVTTGSYHTCALTGAGGVKCWGYSDRLGIGTVANFVTPTPVDVTGLTNSVMAVTAGLDHTCVLLDYGGLAVGVKCWGENDYGQLGDGTTAARTTPVDVLGLTHDATALALGDTHTCALVNNNSVNCWGQNNRGQLGDGTTTNQGTPTNVSTLTNGHLTVYPRYTTLVFSYPGDAGAVSPGTGQYSGSTSFTATPNSGYELERWWVYQNGVGSWMYSNPLTLEIGQDDVIVEADFRPIGTGIYGRVNYQGYGQPDIPLNLRLYNGTSWTTVMATTSDWEGNYSFTGIPSLGPNQLYSVRFLNSTDDPNYLYGWWGNYITEYYAGDNVRGGDADIADIPLGTPNSMADIAFPAEFQWTPRSMYPEEQYAVEVYGDQTYWSPLQAASGSFMLDAVPPEFRAGQDLSWDVVAVMTDGTGIARGTNQVRFAAGSGNLSGHVTYQGRPDPGTYVGLYFYDGSDWQVKDWTATNDDGAYQFSRLPALQSGQSYAPFYLNFDEKSDRIWYGDCYDTTQYDPNAFNTACDLETKDMFIEGPFVQAESFPVRFNWSTRAGLYTEAYQPKVYDFEAGIMFVAPAIDNAQEFTLNALPTGFSGKDYYWEVWSYNSMGRAVSYAFNHVNAPNKVYLPLVISNFNGTALSVSDSVTTGASTAKPAIPQGIPLSRDLHPIVRPAQYPAQPSLLIPKNSAPTADPARLKIDEKITNLH
jgi:alpha-tubulin suppressor-like RCC1 family protein/murein DD-endopeptidase MepM/ murein hydrolase activator NlpD